MTLKNEMISDHQSTVPYHVNSVNMNNVHHCCGSVNRPNYRNMDYFMWF